MDGRDDRENRTLRGRQEAGEDEADRLDLAGAPLPGAILVKTIAVGTYPTAAGAFYAVQAVDPGGAEAEGNAGTFTDVAGTFYATNAGTAVPPSGTRLIAIPSGGRWTFTFNG
jgi:hypothetical protein